MNALTPIIPQKTTSLAVIDTAAPLPDAVRTALHEALAGFVLSVNAPPEDRAANLMAHKKAMKGFHPQLVISALEHLTFHNPRNPFPFTPQDLRERLEFETDAWTAHVLHKLLGRDSYEAFSYLQKKGKLPNFGGEPLTPACAMPEEYLLDLLAKQAARKLDPFVEAQRKRLEALPRSALPEELWEKIAIARASYAEWRGFKNY